MERFWEEARLSGFDTVFAVDFEGSDRTGVVEYGIVSLTADGLGQAYTGLCAPISSVVPDRDRKTHGLGSRELANQSPFADQWELFRGLRGRGPFLAHSAQVEDRFLRRQWRTPGSVPDWSSPGEEGIEWGPWLDSCELFRSFQTEGGAGLRQLIEREGLAEALDEFGANHCPPERNKWHAALYDSAASALLFQRLLSICPDWSLGRVFRESGRGSGGAAEQTGLW